MPNRSNRVSAVAPFANSRQLGYRIEWHGNGFFGYGCLAAQKGAGQRVQRIPGNFVRRGTDHWIAGTTTTRSGPRSVPVIGPAAPRGFFRS